MTLDAAADLAAIDRSGALGDVLASAKQWDDARRLATARLDLGGVDNVIVSGMGGSGICGDIIAALAQTSFHLPVVVHRSYDLPAWAGPRTLVVALSYSGATEETLSAYAAAAAVGAQRFAVAGGGPLAQTCGEDGAPCVVVPSGRQPRFSLGFLLVPILVAMGLDDGLDEAIAVQEDLAASFGPDVATDRNLCKQLALRLVDPPQVPVLLGADGIGATAAYRLKSQLAENAKMPAIASNLPEADHNEVVGWQEPSPLSGSSGLVSIRDRAGEHERIARRFDVTEELLADRIAWRATIEATGSSPLARVASLLMQADLVSVYAALALRRDPTPIPFIDRIKQRLSSPLRSIV